MKPTKIFEEKMRLYVSTNLEYVDQSWEDRYWQTAYNEAEICKYLKVLLEEKMRSGCVYLPILGMYNVHVQLYIVHTHKSANI